jgi:glyoxylase-like metal-dependent hydrolase (beta-lactamase superfamily II)
LYHVVMASLERNGQAPALPDSLRVIVRGWLSCNQVVLDDSDGCTVVDTGHSLHADQTIELLRAAVASKPVRRIVNTHCHVDHMGGNAAVQRAFGARIAIPEGEASGVRPWTAQSFWMEYADQDAERFDYDDVVSAGESLAMGGLAWQAVAAPGHDMGALVFFEPEHRVLISGDALWQKGLGVVVPDGGGRALRAALGTLDAIEQLAPSVVIPGHGEPFGEVGAALRFARKRLLDFRADPSRQAVHVLKAMLVFTLLARGRMALADVPAYLAGVPVYAELNREFFSQSPADLARMIVDPLLAIGALAKEEGYLVPRMKA